MDKLIKYILILFLVATPALGQSFTVKQGKIPSSEVWSGKIILTGDVLVPQDLELTILPDTWLIFNSSDVNNLGQFENKPEIIVEGKLVTQGSIEVLSIHNNKSQEYLESLNAQQISPKDLDLSAVENDWKGFKRQYAYSWALAYSIILLGL